MKPGMVARMAAAGVALVAWAGLVVQCLASYREQGSVLLMLWVVFAFFTITTNLLVAMVFTVLAVGRTGLRSEGVVGGTMLSILLVGVIYGLLLHGTAELSGGSAVANVLLHMVAPVLVPVFWIACMRKGELMWRHPLVWAVYPLAYLAYGLVRGAATGQYAYPFMNVLRIGWAQTMGNAFVIAVGFLACGFLVVWVDRGLGRDSAGRDSLRG
jgi:hypothetical protein